MIDDRAAQALRDRGASRVTGELGDVFMGRARIPRDGSTVELGLRGGLLGRREVTVSGLRAPTVI